MNAVRSHQDISVEEDTLNSKAVYEETYITMLLNSALPIIHFQQCLCSVKPASSLQGKSPKHSCTMLHTTQAGRQGTLEALSQPRLCATLCLLDPLPSTPPDPIPQPSPSLGVHCTCQTRSALQLEPAQAS